MRRHQLPYKPGVLCRASQEVFLETGAAVQTVVPRHLSDSERQPLSIGQGGGIIVNYQLLFQ